MEELISEAPNKISKNKVRDTSAKMPKNQLHGGKRKNNGRKLACNNNELQQNTEFP